MQASAHYIVKDNNVLQCIPTGEVAWHCGSKGNYTSIGIEVIPMNVAGEFSIKSIDSLHELLAILPRVTLKRHYDWTKKDCPLYYTPLAPDGKGDERWENLKLEICNGNTN
jgi:N-acetylmuramoyl-L-alanine amidase CwlA